MTGVCTGWAARACAGNLLFRMGRLAQAEKSLLRSVWLDKSDATALLDLGHVVARQQRHSQARVRFQQAYAAATSKEEAVAADTAMAALYMATGRTQLADAFLQRAASVAPVDQTSLLALVADLSAGAADLSACQERSDGAPSSGSAPREKRHASAAAPPPYASPAGDGAGRRGADTGVNICNVEGGAVAGANPVLVRDSNENAWAGDQGVEVAKD